MYTRTPYKFLSYTHIMLPTTASLTNTVRKRNKAMNWLLEHFPNAFDLRNRKPLKDNILDDIVNSNVPHTPTLLALKEALIYYTQWGSYLSTLTLGTKTIGLNGEFTGAVNADTAQKAQKVLLHATEKFS